MRQQNIWVIIQERWERDNAGRSERLKLVYAVDHFGGTARVPDCNYERGVRVALDSIFRRLDANAFANTAPQGRVVVAEQDWVHGLSNPPAETAGTENDNGGRQPHELKKILSIHSAALDSHLSQSIAWDYQARFSR
jgi:hypothetical protein